MTQPLYILHNGKPRLLQPGRSSISSTKLRRWWLPPARPARLPSSAIWWIQSRPSYAIPARSTPAGGRKAKERSRMLDGLSRSPLLLLRRRRGMRMLRRLLRMLCRLLLKKSPKISLSNHFNHRQRGQHGYGTSAWIMATDGFRGRN